MTVCDDLIKRRSIALLALAVGLGGCGGGTDQTAPPAAMISLAPTSVSFSSGQGGTNPGAQTVSVTSGGGTVSGLGVGTISYGTGLATSWLSTSLSSTVAPATLTLTASTGNLAAGTYTATVPLTASGATNSPQIVAVSFVVSSPASPFAAVASSAGQYFSCGLTGGRAAYCWGSNVSGRLGDGSTTDRLTPVAVTGSLGFASVSAGTGHSCGVTVAGAAYCWGWNYNFELGDGTTTNRSTPTAVA